MTNPTSLALVAGATGVAGRSLVDELVSRGFSVLALSRSVQLDPRPEVTAIPVDLFNAQQVTEVLSGYQVTHLMYAVQYRDKIATTNGQTNLQRLRTQMSWVGRLMPVLRCIPGVPSAIYRMVALESGAGDPEGMNLLLFRTIVEALNRPPHKLQHVSVITGGKHYGMHLGPTLYPSYQSPFREDETQRAPGPNWYYELEDYLEELSVPWSYALFRPSFIIGDAQDAPYNFGTALAVYASLRKARGEPLIFFGDRASRGCQWDITSAPDLARMMAWAAEESAAHGQAFNCTTGVPFTWQEMWPKVAEWFGMEVEFTDVGFCAQRFFEENHPLWQQLIAEHGLQPYEVGRLTSGDFIDRAMFMDWDSVFAMEKANSAGFEQKNSPFQVFSNLFQILVEKRVIPPV